MPHTTEVKAWRTMDDTDRLSALRSSETHLWLVEGRGDSDHATLVVGWSAMVQLLARECQDWKAPHGVIADVEAWLLRDVDQWTFGPNGTACWSVVFDDCGRAVTLVTDTSALMSPSLAVRH
jgi:hypothetical protein